MKINTGPSIIALHNYWLYESLHVDDRLRSPVVRHYKYHSVEHLAGDGGRQRRRERRSSELTGVNVIWVARGKPTDCRARIHA